MKIQINKELILEANRFEKFLKNKPNDVQMDHRRELNNSLARDDRTSPTMMHLDRHNFNGLNAFHLVNTDNLQNSKEFSNDAKLMARANNKSIIQDVEKYGLRNRLKDKIRINKKPSLLSHSSGLPSTFYSGGNYYNFKKETRGFPSKAVNNFKDNGVWVHHNNSETSNYGNPEHLNKQSMQKARHQYYASQALDYGGVPAELIGKIDSKYLGIPENRGYESIIRPQDFKHADYQINKMEITPYMLGQLDSRSIDKGLELKDKYEKLNPNKSFEFRW